MAARPAKGPKAGLEPDEVRSLILDYLYEHHRNARGMRAQELKIRDIQRAMKGSHELAGKDVAASLDYLVQKGWVCQIVRERTFTTVRGAVVPQEQVSYKISDIGIDRVEGESKFKKQSPFGAINIGNVQGAVVVGDHNVVNNQFVSLVEHLSALERAISELAISETEKVSAIADIETIRSQLAKPEPDRNILKQASQGVERIVTAHGFGTVLLEAGRHLARLIS
jgi:hypothetical protein